MEDLSEYDYIVIGAGSAGSAVAARLSEHPAHRVLLLEAGGKDDHPHIPVPALFPALFKTPMDWAFESVPQQQLAGRKEYFPSGKTLGGSSSINAMIYQRGHAAGYDDWAQHGNTGWGWNQVLKYFVKAENQERGISDFHGVGGPLDVSDPRDPHLLSLTFIKACEEQGLPITDDFNTGTQNGFGLYQVTQREGRRCSTALGYLKPALERENLFLVTGAHVRRLLIDDSRCRGVIFQQDGIDHEATASAEVVLCGGAINSPKLLMLSGIGPRSQLEPLGIETRVELSGVGQNLQDHLMVPVANECPQPISLAAMTSEQEAAKYEKDRRGMLSSNHAEAGGFIKLFSDSISPELQFLFAPGWFIMHGMGNPDGHGFTLLSSLAKPKSVGSLTLNSDDPFDPPAIDPNYLSNPFDLQVLIEGMKRARAILSSPAFDPYRGPEFLPGDDVKTDEQIGEFIHQQAQTNYHPVGTCKMGNDALAVVDDRLSVHGVEGLRIADASIMPTIVNANINAACIMIGEKCADMILADNS